ncbi:hypothetical protein Tco_1442875 [Tanacetum coccineum]
MSPSSSSTTAITPRQPPPPRYCGSTAAYHHHPAMASTTSPKPPFPSLLNSDFGAFGFVDNTAHIRAFGSVVYSSPKGCLVADFIAQRGSLDLSLTTDYGAFG